MDGPATCHGRPDLVPLDVGPILVANTDRVTEILVAPVARPEVGRPSRRLDVLMRLPADLVLAVMPTSHLAYRLVRPSDAGQADRPVIRLYRPTNDAYS